MENGVVDLTATRLPSFCTVVVVTLWRSTGAGGRTDTRVSRPPPPPFSLFGVPRNFSATAHTFTTHTHTHIEHACGGARGRSREQLFNSPPPPQQSPPFLVVGERVWWCAVRAPRFPFQSVVFRHSRLPRVTFYASLRFPSRSPSLAFSFLFSSSSAAWSDFPCPPCFLTIVNQRPFNHARRVQKTLEAQKQVTE